MQNEESISYTQLSAQASKAANDYLFAALNTIEERMGKGAAEKYPEIVAALIQATATEYLASMISHRIAPSLSYIADAIDRSNE